jgi:16S rRNA processing protein RimM
VDNILRYTPWILAQGKVRRAYRLIDGRAHGRGIVAQLEGLADRDVARRLIGAEIRVSRAQFAAPGEGRHYWSDLIGLRVVNEAGELLGVVDHLLQTGANDVMVLRGERRRLLPFVEGRIVRKVDVESGLITVDWELDY